MKDKLLVTVIVPKYNYNFNVFIPIICKVGSLKQHFKIILNDYFHDNSIDNSFRLINRNNGIEYDNNSFVRNLNIKNGDTLVLI